MAIPHYSPDSDSFKAFPDATPTEELLTHKHGDLHTVILPALNGGETVVAVADRLFVSPGWVHNWLKRNGYVKQYVRKDGAA